MNGIRSYASEINAIKLQNNGNLEMIENRYTKQEVNSMFKDSKASFVNVRDFQRIKNVLQTKSE